MPQVTLGNIDETIVMKMKRQAGARGRSMEAEHRRIVRESSEGPSDRRISFKEALLAMPDVGEDSDFLRPPQIDRPVGL